MYCTPTYMHPTDLPAVLFLLGYPLFQGDPKHKRTIPAVRQVAVTLRSGLETRECITSIRVLRNEGKYARAYWGPVVSG